LIRHMSDDGGDRRTLEGLPPLVWGGVGMQVVRDDLATDDLTMVPVVKICLAHMGERFSKIYLAGTSGAAFYIGWRADSLWSGMGGSIYAFPEEREPGLVNLSGAVGRTLEVVRKSAPHRLWEAAVESIDGGRPVPCVEWEPVAHRGHWAILAGYDEAKKEFLGRSYEGMPQTEYTRLRPEDLHYIIAIGEKCGKRLSPREAALGALRCAIQMSKSGIRAGEESGAYGLVAYDRESRMILEDMKPTMDGYGLCEHFLFWSLEVLYDCRCYALEYLKEAVQEFSPKNREHVQAAIRCYESFLKYFEENVRIIYGSEAEREGTNLLWRGDGRERPIRELFSTSEGRQLFADCLLHMRGLESSAIDNIQDLVRAEGL
jgi:hypothetical protein